ncbi:uncharacterized protein [Solanum lycopersicum]|uniref:Methyltransferase-related protein n=3 Tax=Solanum subgen. Lycopersicon TaxID=49274 RepID=A0A3Q7H0U1_SOLLC|nr:uncharacterized protein LOC101262017 [Solanum lycopersicum]XP_015078619.1 uncharacterized protein LOC107022543 [Solanum pennellii]TMW86878.1 hypothetical protein EJD97_020756 [Solanum chilense]
MCPLRFILVFFSALLAGYLAWRTVRSSDDLDFANPDDETTKSKSEEERRESDSGEVKFHKFQKIQNGFWVFVDMASGKYLWRNLKSMNNVVDKTN